MADLAELDIMEKRRYRAELARSETFTREQIGRYAEDRLRQLLEHAQRNVPYWRKRLAPVLAGGHFNSSAWQKLTPLVRPTVVAKFAELSAREVPDFAGKSSIGLTSGSTGAPLRYRACGLDNIASAALTERSFDWWKLDGQRDLGQIQFLPPDWPGLVDGGIPGWRPGPPNGKPVGRGLALQIDEHIDVQLQWLARWRPAYLATRPSQIEALADENLRRGLGLSFLRIMTVGGPVSAACRELCRRSFGAEIYDTYGSSECGHIAAECPDCRLLHVNAEARLVEVVGEDLRPCAPGEVGRVLVTSYTNFAMPLIRYDLGDYAEAGPLAAPCGRPFPSLARVLGRETEAFIRRDGSRFFPTILARTLQVVMPLKQVQFVQTDYGRVEIRYVPADGNPPVDVDAVQRYVKARIGEEFSATLVALDEIPRRPGAKYFYHRCEVSRPAAVQ